MNSIKENKKKELVIIGLGPAGLSASIYASRYGIKHSILGLVSGGQISETHEIDNYLGLPSLSGANFSQKALEHVKKYEESEIIFQKIEKIEKIENGFQLFLSNKETILTQRILLALGAKKRKLNIKGEKKLLGRGVSYCATCDGFFYKNKKVAVVGGSDSAAGAAVFLGDLAEKVFIIYRGEKLRAEKYWLQLIAKNPKIEIIYTANLEKIRGEEKLEEVVLDTGQKIIIDGLFIEAGSVPNLSIVDRLGLIRDDGGFLRVDASGKTSVNNVWAAGDITTNSDKFRQVITAAAEGAIAARSIFNSIKKNDEKAK